MSDDFLELEDSDISWNKPSKKEAVIHAEECDILESPELPKKDGFNLRVKGDSKARVTQSSSEKIDYVSVYQEIIIIAAIVIGLILLVGVVFSSAEQIQGYVNAIIGTSTDRSF